MEFLKDNRLLLIGGTGRNVGKTTLACRIIEKVSKEAAIIGLKVSTQKPGEMKFHGTGHTSFDKYSITHEESIIPSKDTAKMINCGALASYYIETKADYVTAAYNGFKKQISADMALVCESRTLRDYIKPALFIMLVNEEHTKSDSLHFIKLADVVFKYQDGLDELQNLVEAISYSNENGWIINKI